MGSRLSVHIAGMRPSGVPELLEQQFSALGAGSGTVGAELAKRGLTVVDFVRLEVGEGMEARKEEDFAAAVKAALKQ